MTSSLGPLVQSFFTDHLPVQKGLRQGSIRSYRDTIRLFLCFVSEQRGSSIASLALDDLSFEQALAFLKYLEQQRGNSVRTRNQRRAALNTFLHTSLSECRRCLQFASGSPRSLSSAHHCLTRTISRMMR